MKKGPLVSLFVLLTLLSVVTVSAQSTAFTYQGKLTEMNSPPTANYDFEFRLFDALTAGTQQGTTQTVLNVAVTGGVFTVSLDFGPQFPGAGRFLDISVRPSGGGAYTPLSPRQSVTSTPYSVRSLNTATADALSANCVGCVTSSQIGGVNGSAVSGPIPVASVPSGSVNYIQNSFSQQIANFNISGNGTAAGTLSGNVVNATTQYNLGTSRVLSVAGDGNLFVGISAGEDNAAGGVRNSFFGSFAGANNTNGSENSFFGRHAGLGNSTGTRNSFFGNGAGISNTTANNNSFFGDSAGLVNTTGLDNSFFGKSAGAGNTTGADNSFFGRSAGLSNTDGDDNSAFGYFAGSDNTTGSRNSFFGTLAGTGTSIGNGNSFFGYAAGASTDADNNSFFGLSSGASNTTGTDNVFVGRNAGNFNFTGSNNTTIGSNSNVASAALSFATAIGAGAVVSASNTVVLGRALDTVSIPGTLSATGSVSFPSNSITDAQVSDTLTASNLVAGSSVVSDAEVDNNLTINGGTINNSVIGGTTPADGTFANLTVNGTLTASGAGLTGLNAANITTGILPIARGGTGSGTQNFVDLTTVQTINANKHINGTLSGTIVSATGQYNIGSSRVLLATCQDNTFVGLGAGESNVGCASPNGGGNRNSFFGANAGSANTGTGSTGTAQHNSFFGANSGDVNTSGLQNSFFGSDAGGANLTGDQNSFFGFSSGLLTTSNGNSFFGSNSGDTNTSGSNNSIFGAFADVGAGNLTNATAVGHRAFVSQSNSLVLGSINGVNSATADTNVGIGTTAPTARLDVRGGAKIGNAGEFDVVAGEERLRILRGSVSTGGTSSGAGWGSAKTAGQPVGDYTITFSTAYTSNPTVTATAVDATVLQFAVIAGLSTTTVRVRTFNSAGALVDTQFLFTVIGTW